METYTTWVAANPLLAAALQFALLGTLGELLSHLIITRRPGLPCTVPQLLAKMLGWAVLGVIIKYGFSGMKGFTRALVDHKLLPALCGTGLGWAFAVSVLTNIFFGPQMMAFHRLTDNLILRRSGFAGIQRAWWTLLWFWIPAHTLTFSLPLDYQVGLAAVWSVVLGIIMGLSAQKGPR
jgi:hypothetical protein